MSVQYATTISLAIAPLEPPPECPGLNAKMDFVLMVSDTSTPPQQPRVKAHLMEGVGGADECWPWHAATNGVGYGVIKASGERRMLLAHRAMYELRVGPIPAGCHLHHVCENPACVNPAHLEPLSPTEHATRGGHGAATHCKRGHPFTPENTRRRKDRPGRTCRACDAIRAREYLARRRAA